VRRPSPWLVVLLALVIVTALELLGDLHPFRWVFWTHKQAMDYGGLAFLAVMVWALLRRP